MFMKCALEVWKQCLLPRSVLKEYHFVYIIVFSKVAAEHCQKQSCAYKGSNADPCHSREQWLYSLQWVRTDEDAET